MHADLFGGLMSVINTFANKITEDGISNIEFSSKHFCIYKKNNVLFVGNSTKDISENQLSKELKVVSDIFFNTYPEGILYNFDGNVKRFHEFGVKIKDSLMDIL